MNRVALALLIGILCSVQSIKTTAQSIIIEADVPVEFKKDSVMVQVYPAHQVDMSYSRIDTCKISNGKIKLVLDVLKPTCLYSPELLGDIAYLAEPGDRIRIRNQQGNLFFSGKGSEKFELVYRAHKIKGKLSYSKVHNAVTRSLEDYLVMSRYVDTLIKGRLQLLRSFRGKISSFAYAFLEADLIALFDYSRCYKFQRLMRNPEKYNLSSADLSAIFDSTIAVSHTRKLINSDTASLSSFFIIYLSVYNEIDFSKSQNFKEKITNENAVQHAKGEFSFAKKKYNKLARERLLMDILTYRIIGNFGINKEVVPYINDYMSLPGYPEYKVWTKDFIVRAKTRSNGRQAPAFSLPDTKGKKLSLDDFKGKVVILDFWFTGCAGCVKMTPALSRVEEVFRNNPNVSFLSISIDLDKSMWEKSVSLKKYTTGEGINLYTEGLGMKHKVIKAYDVNAFPTLYLIDPDGNITHNPAPDPREDSGKPLISLINKELTKQFDGPYVLYRGKQVITKYVDYVNGKKLLRADTVIAESRDKIMLTVHTDVYGKTFQMPLKDSLTNEPSTYSKPEKVLALSDIEGNLEAFRKLLQSNGIIDKDYNWTFGNGHLVLNGDFFDRGAQVTECLWLIYYLEEKAKAKGGYVHFILGNHEIMNLNGDKRYAVSKYTIDNLDLLQEKSESLYNENSELGRWLRTKNILEKIGDVLYVHGGISQDMNNMKLSIAETNDLARRYYAADSLAKKSDDPIVKSLFYPTYSPFWYRNYYQRSNGGSINPRNKATLSQVDSTLVKFDVKRIVTGHTLIEDTVSAHFNGTVINIDTHHARGKSEALLIEGDKYYRVNGDGRKEPLFYPVSLAENRQRVWKDNRTTR